MGPPGELIYVILLFGLAVAIIFVLAIVAIVHMFTSQLDGVRRFIAPWLFAATLMAAPAMLIRAASSFTVMSLIVAVVSLLIAGTGQWITSKFNPSKYAASLICSLASILLNMLFFIDFLGVVSLVLCAVFSVLSMAIVSLPTSFKLLNAGYLDDIHSQTESVRFRCSKCNKQLTVDYQDMGKQVRCNGCHEVARIPQWGVETKNDTARGKEATPSLRVVQENECLSCGATMSENEETCSKCGWTYRP